MTAAELIDRCHPTPVYWAVSPLLVGMKKAVFCNGILQISPAMSSLLQGSESPEELLSVLKNIPVTFIETPDLTNIPMTTRPPTIISP